MAVKVTLPKTKGKQKVKAPPQGATLDEMREVWRVLARHRRHLKSLADDLLAHVASADPASREAREMFKAISEGYTEEVREAWKAVKRGIGVASRLCEEDRQEVEAKVGPLFGEDGRVTKVWREAWLADVPTEAVNQARALWEWQRG